MVRLQRFAVRLVKRDEPSGLDAVAELAVAAMVEPANHQIDSVGLRQQQLIGVSSDDRLRRSCHA